MTHIAYSQPKRRLSLHRGNPLVVYATVVVGSMLLLGGVAVAAVV